MSTGLVPGQQALGYPQTASAPMIQVAPGKLRNPAVVILLAIVTLGIYGLYWWWVSLDDVKMWRGGQGWGGTMLLLGLIPFVGLVLIALPFLLPSYIADLYRRNGMAPSVSGPTGLLILIPIVGGIIWLVLVQNALNDFWRSRGVA